jgi:hypothetical protein
MEIMSLDTFLNSQLEYQRIALIYKFQMDGIT